MKKGVVELTERFKAEQQTLTELNAKAKQIKEALATVWFLFKNEKLMRFDSIVDRQWYEISS